MVRKSETDDIGYCTSDAETVMDDSPFDDSVTQQKLATVDEVGDMPDEEFLTAAAKKCDGKDEKKKVYKWDIVWRNVILAIAYHVGAVIGMYLYLYKVKSATTIWATALGFCSALGITAGAHRLWAHKTYKARLPLKCLLLLFQTLAFQNSVIEWCRDHRVHHKFTETDADPHNAKRGFFFSHIGWLMIRKHDDVKNIGKKVSVQDLRDDPMLDFQDRYYVKLVYTISAVIPTLVPIIFFGESCIYSFLVAWVLRYVVSLNCTWCINSVAHLFGHRPYDKNIYPRQNMLASFLALGEGWHNYHHKFPRDYRASEYPGYWINPTTYFIEFMALIGLAYDLKTTSPEAVARTKARHGDGTN